MQDYYLGLESGAAILDRMAAEYSEIQFIRTGNEQSSVKNVSVFNVDIEQAEKIKDSLRRLLESKGIDCDSEMLLYTFNREPFYEEIITKFVELNVTANDLFIWGAERGCISFPAMEDERIPIEVKEEYETLLRTISESDNTPETFIE